MDEKGQSAEGKRKALFVTAVVPQKRGAGLYQRSYRDLDLLAQIFSVDLLLLTCRPEQDALDRLPVSNVFWLMSTYRNGPAWLGRVPGGQLAWRLYQQATRSGQIRSQAGFQETILELERNEYDLALFFRLSTLPLLRHLSERKSFICGTLIVDFDDIESKARRRSLPFVRASQGRQKWLSTKLDASVARRRESAGLALADEVWVCSEEDRRELAARPQARATVVSMPNSIYLPARLPRSAGGLTLLFVGLMEYFPNADAMAFFVRQVWPTLRDRFGADLRLNIVGLAPPEEILALGGEQGITVTGWVEEIEPYYAAADLVIAPIRFGGGTRIKILEAMAYGRLVVSTTVGCEGLGLRDGEEIIVADSAEDFGRACIRSLEDPLLRVAIEDRARRLVETRYGFASVWEEFRNRYGGAPGQPPTRNVVMSTMCRGIAAETAYPEPD